MPPNCEVGYQGPSGITDGLPVGTTIEIEAKLFNFVPTVPEEPGGEYPGGTEGRYDASLQLAMMGTGTLAGFNRLIVVPVICENHWAARTPGDAVQSFVQDFQRIEGAIFGDPDFDELVIFGGSTAFGVPSPGQTVLTRLGPPGSDFEVDSFFDITYQISFVGAAGSVLQDLGGKTDRTDRFEMCNGGTVQIEASSWGQVKSLYR
jgi:hypothetical protein